MSEVNTTIAAAAQAPSMAPEDNGIFSRRSRRQLGLFFGGATFLTFSTLITRRALVRKYWATLPKFYTPSNTTKEVNGAMEAFEALNLATLNVASLGIMLTGGILWAFDIGSLPDMQRKVRAGMGLDGSGRDDKEIEQEIEEWFATVLKRKEFKSLHTQEIKDQFQKELEKQRK